ncbi:MAG: 2-phospho-L-lactate transferase [Actinobacteria bacterium RBG_16_68_21]|nr:MAG: 2-phospho-L-lactate transferase [Actinobacteria bacterium RBG_16_68_21]
MSRVTLLSGGVGGARAARGFATILAPGELTIVVNVGDDERIHGVHVSADLDTVVYTLADREGPHGWGLAGDTFHTMDRLAGLGIDTTFRIGDADLATCLARTVALESGERLSTITTRIAESLGVHHAVVPATDDELRTRLRAASGRWLHFQEYFVLRGQRDEVSEVRFDGAAEATPAPGVIAAIATAELVVIAPSNPPLSVWPILAVPGIRDAVLTANRVVAVSPLFGGKALKGPADRVMASLGLPPGNTGVLAAYEDLLTDLVVDREDADDVDRLSGAVAIHACDTRIPGREAAAQLATTIMGLP